MKYYWIKQRYNPQIGITFYPKGQMSKKQARDMENTIYGSNTLISYKTKEEYDAEIERLKAEGECVRM